jgi:phosphate transport system permease protein
VTAIILATARGIGETSPVLLTSGFTAAFNADPFHGPMVSLPLAVFQFVKSPEPGMIARGFGTAAVLMLLVLILFIIARMIGGETVAKKEARAENRRKLWASLRKAYSHLTAAMSRTLSKITQPLKSKLGGVESRIQSEKRRPTFVEKAKEAEK